MGNMRAMLATGMVCLSLVAGAGCSSGKAGGGNGKPATATADGHPNSAATPNGVEKLPVQEIVTRAEKAMNGVHSLHEVVGLPDAGIDVAMDDKGNCRQSIRVDNSHLSLIKQGDTVYLKGDSGYWKSTWNDQVASAVQRQAGDRYVKTSTSDKALYSSGLADACDLHARISNWFGTGAGRLLDLQDLVVHGVTEVDGVPAVELRGIPKNTTIRDVEAARFIALDGEPYVLESVTSGVVTKLIDPDKPVPGTVPAASDTVDASDIAGLDGH